MAKIQIGPRLEQATYDELVARVGKENVNKFVVELIEKWLNPVEVKIQLIEEKEIENTTTKQFEKFDWEAAKMPWND